MEVGKRCIDGALAYIWAPSALDGINRTPFVFLDQSCYIIMEWCASFSPR